MEPYAPYPLNVLRDWLHRRRWWIRCLLAVALVPYLGHFTYTRWTMQPPLGLASWDYDIFLAVPPPEVDRTADLVAAIKSLPPTPTVTIPTTAPEGWRWVPYRQAEYWRTTPQSRNWNPGFSSQSGTTITVDLSNALYGEWIPDERLQLSEIVKYIESPAVHVALERITSLSGEPFCLTSTAGFGPLPGGRVRELTRLLGARVRYHMVQKNSFELAARDACTILRLSGGFEDDGMPVPVLVGFACRSYALHEIMILSREFWLTSAETREFIRWLEEHPFDGRQAWITALEGDAAGISAYLDHYYTNDGEGHGWAVLRRRKETAPDDRLLYSLNLLSPLFEDRQRMHDLLASHYDRYIAAGYRSYRDAKPELEALDQVPERPAVPPELMFAMGGGLRLCLREQAQHGATIVSLALSAYVTDHGQYPQELSMLVPDYMSAVPEDPFSGGALCYRLDDYDGYLLYSVGEDTEDNGGVFRDEEGEPVPWPDRRDWVFPEWRGPHGRSDKPWGEWVLIDEEEFGQYEGYRADPEGQ